MTKEEIREVWEIAQLDKAFQNPIDKRDETIIKNKKVKNDAIDKFYKNQTNENCTMVFGIICRVLVAVMIIYIFIK